MGQVDIYYEKKLKEVFIIAADNPEGIIYTEQTWNYFIALVLKKRLAGAVDIDKLEKVRPSFPLTFETLCNTIQQAFGDQTLKQLDANMDEARE